jgi:phospholipid/cholesterol/gamma-HCH transport system substrate-binding protein
VRRLVHPPRRIDDDEVHEHRAEVQLMARTQKASSRRLFRVNIPSFRSLNPLPVGAFFIVGVLIILYFAFELQNLPFIRGRSYTVAFAEAAGLRKGDKVRVAGLDVGQVEQVALEGSHVRVRFNVHNSSVHLGEQTSASIQIFTLLGNKYLALQPAGPGNWPTSREIPLNHTTSPYDVSPAFQDLASTVGSINKKQLADAFNTIAETFKNSPAPLKSTLTGLTQLSNTIASRDDQISELLKHLANVTGVLAQRRTQFVQILQDGDKLLKELDARRTVINQLLTNTSSLAQQLEGLTKDSQATLKPALDHLHNVVKILDDNQKSLDETITLLYPTTRNLIDVVGSGGWYDASVVNVLNPFQLVGGKGTPTLPLPKTLADLLGISSLQQATGK